jgi:hypothetical protein
MFSNIHVISKPISMCRTLILRFQEILFPWWNLMVSPKTSKFLLFNCFHLFPPKLLFMNINYAGTNIWTVHKMPIKFANLQFLIDYSVFIFLPSPLSKFLSCCLCKSMTNCCYYIDDDRLCLRRSQHEVHKRFLSFCAVHTLNIHLISI